jgi:hypothetical protein
VSAAVFWAAVGVLARGETLTDMPVSVALDWDV